MFSRQQMASWAEVCSITTCVTSELGEREENETQLLCRSCHSALRQKAPP